MKGLLLDEMISPKVAEQLRALGVDVVAISESPTLRRTPDPDVLELAAGQDRVLVTDNIKDFAPLNASWAAQGRTHHGILFISSRTYPHDRSRVGHLVSALQQRVSADRWPTPGQVAFL